MTVKILSSLLPIGVATLLSSGPVVASGNSQYEVTITNLTRGQTFTPILVTSHRPGVKLFALGEPASGDLSMLAEGGDTGPLTTTLESDPRVVDVQNSGGPLSPGQSVSVKVDANHGARRISLASMLIPTNDAFIALNGVKVPRGHKAATYWSVAYDAGSELNDEDCDHIPGPETVCKGEGASLNAGGEDYVHIHAGIHGIGNLLPEEYDWRNPVAKIKIRRVHEYSDND